MNKYLEALKTVEKSCISVAMEFNFGELFEEDEKALSTLQELVDKATPKKPEYLNYGGYKLGNYHCPNCNSIIIIDNRNYKLPKHCGECDQLLDWSDEDD